MSMLERLTPEASYVYYLAVGESVRHQGIGGLLLDDALARFRSEGARIVYGAAEEDNTTSIALFRSRGFRVVERDEPGLKEGGLGAWGLRSRMMLVSGEVLLGLRLQAAPAPGRTDRRKGWPGAGSVRPFSCPGSCSRRSAVPPIDNEARPG